MTAKEIVSEELTKSEWSIKSRLETAHTFKWKEETKIELKKALEIIGNLKNIIDKSN